MSDPKSTPDGPGGPSAPDGGDDAVPLPGRTAPYAPPAAFVVPYESYDGDLEDPPPAASVIVRPSYANEMPGHPAGLVPPPYADEVPPVVAPARRRPGEDEPTTRVPVVDDAELDAPDADGEPPEGPTRRIAVVTDDDLEDEEARTGTPPPVGAAAGGQPAVIIDGPSEAYAPKGADRCPYCLTFVGISHARSRGVRYCPMCGADWASLDRKVEAPSGAVIPLGDEALPPLLEDALEDHPTNQYLRTIGPTRPPPGDPAHAPPAAAPRAEPARPARRGGTSPWLMLLTGVSLGLAGTMTVAWLYNRGAPPQPTVIAGPAASAPEAPSAPPVAVAARPTAPQPVEPPPVEPAAPVEPPPVEPAAPVEPVAPVEPPPPVISDAAIQAALIDAASLLPPSAIVDVRPRVDRDVVFLTGQVDGNETLGHIIAAVAAVEGVRAVDSRGVQPAWRTHVVVRGDSLSRIAQLYYGDTNQWPLIFEANRDVVDRPQQLIPGMKLRIPVGGKR